MKTTEAMCTCMYGIQNKTRIDPIDIEFDQFLDSLDDGKDHIRDAFKKARKKLNNQTFGKQIDDLKGWSSTLNGIRNSINSNGI